VNLCRFIFYRTEGHYFTFVIVCILGVPLFTLARAD